MCLSVSLVCLSTLHIRVSSERMTIARTNTSHAHIPFTSRLEVCRQKEKVLVRMHCACAEGGDACSKSVLYRIFVCTQSALCLRVHRTISALYPRIHRTISPRTSRVHTSRVGLYRRIHPHYIKFPGFLETTIQLCNTNALCLNHV